jgi:tetratricopeptide (TPR) repeat protein
MLSIFKWFKQSKTAVQYYNAALSHYNQQNWTGCVQLLQQCLTLDANFADAHFNLSCAYQKLEDHALAKHHLEEAVKLNPADMDATYNLGLVLLDTDDIPGAITHFEKVLLQNPNDINTLLGMGLCWAAKNDVEQATAFFLQALALQPDLPVTNYHLGKLAMRNGLPAAEDIETVLNYYKQALAEFAHDPSLHLDMSLLAAKLTQWPVAMHHALQCVTIDPQQSKGYNQLGLALYCQNEYEEAIVHFQSALSIDPAYYTVYNNLSFAFEKSNRLDEALNALHHYLEYIDDPQERQITEEHMKDLLKKGAKP